MGNYIFERSSDWDGQSSSSALAADVERALAELDWVENYTVRADDGGVWVISAEGRHLGTIQLPELPANFAWGGPDGATLYMTARHGLYRMRLAVPGAGR